ncbi:MAG: ribonuclease T [Oceanococcus sp.]
MRNRFRGFLPVIVDVETGGFNCATDALLEIGVHTVDIDLDGQLSPGEAIHFHVAPFEGSNIEDAALEITGIKPFSPLRAAEVESNALGRSFQLVRRTMRKYDCKRAVLVGHNAHFDLGFINAAVERCGIKRNPFHPFSVFDTATLAGATLGQTVLAKAISTAGIEWDQSQAHSARYDAAKTAELYCAMLNSIATVHQTWVRSGDDEE